MSTVYLAAGNTMMYANSSGVTLASGTVVETDDMHGVVIKDILNGAEGPLKINGIADLDATGATIANAGIALYWDSTNELVTNTAGAWKRIGTSGGALSAITTNYVPVILNMISEPGASSSLLDIKQNVTIATAAALSACTAAGTGIGKTLTANANGVETIDGVALALNARVLVKNQGLTGKDNGIYLCTTAGAAGAKFVLTRATDADTDDRVTTGMVCFVDQGTISADLGYILTTNEPFTLDTDALAFDVFGIVTAGTGMTKTANTLNVIGGDGMTANANDIAVDLMTNAGISIDTAQIKLDMNDLGAAVVDVTADSLGIIDATDSSTKKESIDDIVTALAGDGLQNTASQFAFDASDVAGKGIAASGENLDLDINSCDAGAVDVTADSFAILDATDSASKKESIDDLVTAMAGDGLQNTASQFAFDASDVAGTGIEASGEDLRLAAQGNGIGGGAGSTLSVTPDVTTGGNVVAVDVTANGVGLDLEDIDGDGLRASGGELHVDTSDFAGVGLEDDGSENLRLSAQGNGITGGAGSTLSVESDVTTGGNIVPIDVAANGIGLDLTDIDGDGLRASGGELHVDTSDFAGVGLEDDGSENLRLSAQGTGISGGAGSTLSVDTTALNHDDLANKDGGSGAEFYHLTLAQHGLTTQQQSQVTLSGTTPTFGEFGFTTSGDHAFAVGTGGEMWHCAQIGAGRGYSSYTAM